ncbi:hypothetical protein RR46_02374 [Papilio xuthus]|uniref:Uncharacterized protein n=1 Tax=Papilio xuthus TaxID=66420 RepID=A0A194Q0P6_PAPXU|nr:hypothetical protein RR46_02374 [Papilio xuthus]
MRLACLACVATLRGLSHAPIYDIHTGAVCGAGDAAVAAGGSRAAGSESASKGGMFGAGAGVGAGAGGYGEGGEAWAGYVGGGRLQQYAHFAPHQNVWHHHPAAHHDSYEAHELNHIATIAGRSTESEAIRGVARARWRGQCAPRPLTVCSCVRRDLLTPPASVSASRVDRHGRLAALALMATELRTPGRFVPAPAGRELGAIRGGLGLRDRE